MNHPQLYIPTVSCASLYYTVYHFQLWFYFSTLLSPLAPDSLEVMNPVDMASIQGQCLPHIKNLTSWEKCGITLYLSLELQKWKPLRIILPRLYIIFNKDRKEGGKQKDKIFEGKEIHLKTFFNWKPELEMGSVCSDKVENKRCLKSINPRYLQLQGKLSPDC